MSQGSLTEVFTVDEVARAAGVPADAVRTLLGRGDLSFVPDTPFIHVANPARSARRLREAALALHAQPATELFEPARAPRETRKPVVLSLVAHAAVALLLIVLSMDRTETAPVEDPVHEETHLVFLLSPGPGGGGGGGGLRQPRPAPKIARRGEPRLQVSVPRVSEKPVMTTAREEDTPKPTPVQPVIQPPTPEPAPEPTPAKVIVAPVETVAANDRDRQGAIEHAVEGPDGGGPYRPGSGVEPPRLLREVKATYTEEARRRGITGDVLMEVVVRRDGSVGDAHVLQGLGYGLEERAISAVKQWRFAPAMRKGVPVDVLVEVAVEFTLR